MDRGFSGGAGGKQRVITGRQHFGQCLLCRVYLWLVHPSLRGGGGHRLHTTLAGFNVGLVSGGRWQRKRCICTGRLAIGEADGLDTRRTRPSHYLRLSTGLQWKGKKGQTDCDEGGLVTDPVMGLSSGCFVGLELIEGGS